MMKTNQLFLFVLIGYLLSSACNSRPKTGQETKVSDVIPVSLIDVSAISMNTEVKATGLLATENETKHAFKIGGVIDKIYLGEGQSFTKGQLLASLIMTEVESGFAQAELALEKAKRDFQRVQNLYADSVLTLEQWQNSKTMLELAEQQLASVAFNKKYAFIYAEMDGTVIKKMASAGEVVSGGTPVLASSDRGKNSWVMKIGLSDREWAKVSLGDKSKVMLDAYPNIWWDGRVFRKSGAADPNTGSFQVEVKLTNLDTPAALGMFGKAIIETSETQNLKLIPFQALVEADGNNAYVFVPVGKGKVKKQAVLLDGFSDSGVKIKSGLEGITHVILGNSAFLNENSTIAIID